MMYNIEERIGVLSIAKIFITDFNWIFREQPINDFGVDGLVEITNDTNSGILPTGRLIGVQIKSGSSFFKELDSENFVYRGTKRHLNYWLNYSLPLILILYDKTVNTAYWEEVNESTTIFTKNAFKINIPRRKVLDRSSIDSLKKIGYFKNRYEYNLWNLRSSVDEIRSITQRKKYLYVEIDTCHWTKGYQIGLIIKEEPNYGPGIFHGSDCPYWFYLPKNGNLTEGIKEVLPWAELYYGDKIFSDNLFLESSLNEIRYFVGSDLDEEIFLLKEQGLVCDIACLLAGNCYFILEILPNDLAFAFLRLNNFLDQEEKVEQRLFS